MHADGCSVLLFFQILLLGYWLGAGRDIEERLRVREIRYKVDLAPRASTVLLVAFLGTAEPF